MNHRKTNTIQNKRTINKSGFLSSLLLFFLLVSCGVKHSDIVPYPKVSNNVEEHNKQAHINFMDKVGGIGPCTYDCLRDNFVELAKQNMKKGVTVVKKVEGQDSWIIPKKTVEGKQILQFIAEDKVVGNQEGRQRWKVWRRQQQQAGRKTREGVFGIIGKGMLEELAASGKEDKGENHRDPIIYTALKLMELKTTLDNVTTWNKPAVIEHYNRAIAKFEADLALVAPTANGVRIIITPPANEQDKAELKFEPLQEMKSSKKHKPFRLPDTLHKKITTKLGELKAALADAEKNLQ